jgi:hypothetical protein
MVPPGPDYHLRKLQKMVSLPDIGVGTWIGIIGLTPGFVLICMGIAALFSREEATPTFPDVGPSWSGRRKGQQNTSDVCPSRENLSEEKRGR